MKKREVAELLRGIADYLENRDVDYKPRAYRGGVRYVVSTDAHSPAELDYMRLGVSQARKGWLEKGDVLNTAGPGDVTGFFEG